MPATQVIRTFSVTGADDAGKTSLVESFLHLAQPKKAAPDGSTDRLDADPEEKKRNFSLNIHPLTVENGDRLFNVLDCPGFAGFLTEVEWALQVTDGAILVLSAVDGAHNRAERPYDVVAESKLPTLGVINRMDHEQAKFTETVADVEASLKVKPVLLQLPIGTGPEFKGVVDLLTQKAHIYDQKGFGKYTETDVPDDMKDQVEEARMQLVEVAAENDDELLGKYLDDGVLTDEEVLHGLVAGVKARKFLPILLSAAKPGIGVPELLDAVERLLPGPRGMVGKKPGGDEAERKPEAAAPFCGQVFRTTIDHFAGRVDYIRIFSGSIEPGASVVNPRTGTEERVAHFFRTDGAKTEELKTAGPGEIIVINKLKDAHTGDTLCDPGSPVTLSEFEPASRPVAYVVHAKGADDKAATALAKLIEEDPSLELDRTEDTGELLLRGMGQAHIEVTVERAHRKHGVELTLELPTPLYLETITATAKAQGKFKRQTGGHGQFGDCHIELSPKGRGEGFEFEDAIVGGVIPRQFIPSVEKGIRGAMGSGPLAGYPVVDVKAKLFFGSHHSVDSSDNAFQVAGSMAFKKAVLEAKPILLEPYMELEVQVPEEYVGAVMGDLNSRRARVQGMEPVARGVLVRASCPHSEALNYDGTLRSLTQGAGYFMMKFSHYEPMPPSLAQEIIDKRRADGKVKGVED